uniref:Uncharacterized protein n=1 Tax=Glossina pallidipes TaxID=7398 RepID=A0A1B0AEI9_GLOPL
MTLQSNAASNIVVLNVIAFASQNSIKPAFIISQQRIHHQIIRLSLSSNKRHVVLFNAPAMRENVSINATWEVKSKVLFRTKEIYYKNCDDNKAKIVNSKNNLFKEMVQGIPFAIHSPLCVAIFPIFLAAYGISVFPFLFSSPSSPNQRLAVRYAKQESFKSSDNACPTRSRHPKGIIQKLRFLLHEFERKDQVLRCQTCAMD